MGHLRMGAVGFNEAGAFLLRKLLFRVILHVLLSRFNEAGAFLLRKPRVVLQPPQVFARFNEAGAFLLRKRLMTPASSPAARPASMKPEHFCSGNSTDDRAATQPHGPASMKPEHFCSGNAACYRHRA